MPDAPLDPVSPSERRLDPLVARVRRRVERFRPDSIRNQILAFALAATLIPAAVSLGISYGQNKRLLEARVAEDLRSQSRQGAGAIGVWLKERLYDLRVFAGSDEVVNNLAGGAGGGSPTSGRLHDYLVSLHERFGDFEQIAVVDRNGRVVATSLRHVTPIALGDDWVQAMRRDNRVIGRPRADPTSRRTKLVVAVPVRGQDGRVMGALAADLNLAQMHGIVRAFAHEASGWVTVLDTGGTTIARSDAFSPRAATPIAERTRRKLLANRGEALEYGDDARGTLVGTLDAVPQAPWAVVAEVSATAAYQEMRSFRNVALAVVVLLLLASATAAWRLGLIIVRPLDRLTLAASEVAAGDLAVDLPPGGAGEVGSLTSVFNHMVRRLREGRRELDLTNAALQLKNEELERLSATDSLTGLANHRALVQRLRDEAARSRRSGRPFAVVMTDVDHFKDYNDAFGHPAGDEVLKRIGALLADATRAVDCVARYGGEEFALVLPETDIAGALLVAERIRARVAEGEFPGRRVTLSLGVAEFPTSTDSADGIIAVADQALYRAKRNGRDRVEAATGKTVAVR